MSDRHWSVRASRYVFRERWLTVRADDCTTRAGVDVSPFYVLEYPDFVFSIAFDEADRIILVRQYRHGLRGMSLELPGGMMDAGEDDPVAAAKRELQEETGYVGGTHTALVTLAHNPATFDNRSHLVRATGVIAGPKSEDPAEETETVLVSRQEALRLALTGGIVSAQHVGMLLLALSPAVEP